MRLTAKSSAFSPGRLRLWSSTAGNGFAADGGDLPRKPSLGGLSAACLVFVRRHAGYFQLKTRLVPVLTPSSAPRPISSTPAVWQRGRRAASRSASSSSPGTAGTAPRGHCSSPATAACAVVRKALPTTTGTPCYSWEPMAPSSLPKCLLFFPSPSGKCLSQGSPRGGDPHTSAPRHTGISLQGLLAMPASPTDLLNPSWRRTNPHTTAFPQGCTPLTCTWPAGHTMPRWCPRLSQGGWEPAQAGWLASRGTRLKGAGRNSSVTVLWTRGRRKVFHHLPDVRITLGRNPASLTWATVGHGAVVIVTVSYSWPICRSQEIFQWISDPLDLCLMLGCAHTCSVKAGPGCGREPQWSVLPLVGVAAEKRPESQADVAKGFKVGPWGDNCSTRPTLRPKAGPCIIHVKVICSDPYLADIKWKPKAQWSQLMIPRWSWWVGMATAQRPSSRR